MTTTLKAAEAIRQSLIEKIGYYSDDAPTIRAHDGATIVEWISGPPDWPLNDNHTLHAELAPIAAALTYEPQAEPFYRVPRGFYAEPVNSYLLAIYTDHGETT